MMSATSCWSRSARRLQGLVRDVDFVARLGGDEFVILLPGLRSPEARRAAGAARAAAAGRAGAGRRPPAAGRRHDRHCLLSEGRQDGDALFKYADIALYAAKAARARHVPLLRRADDPHGERAPPAGERPAPRAGESRPGGSLPADVRRRQPGARRVRGVGAVAASGPRLHLAGDVHPHRRRLRPDQPARPLGASRKPAPPRRRGSRSAGSR